jgi:hypothetical protein
MNPIDKDKLTDHLQTCIEISEKREDGKIAEVLRNLLTEINSGAFDQDEN